MDLAEYFLMRAGRGTYIHLTDPGWYDHEFCTAKGLTRMTVDAMGEKGFKVGKTGASIFFIKRHTDSYNPDEMLIEPHGAFWSEAYCIVSLLEGTIDLAVKIIEHYLQKEEKNDYNSGYWEDELKTLKNILIQMRANEKLLKDVFYAIGISFKVIHKELKDAEETDEEDRKVWESLDLEEVASYKDSSTMVSPASVYLREGGTTEDNNAQEIARVKKEGELVKILRLQETFQSYKIAKIYKCGEEYYCLVEKSFDNLQGLTVEQETLYKVLNPDCLDL